MYRYIRDKKTNRDKHCLVMEEILDRPLFKFEVVHHRDEDGHNNDFDNLRVMYKWCHAFYHHKDDSPSEETRGKLREAGLKFWEIKLKNIPEGYSICSRCGKLLSLDKFVKDKYRKRGVYSSCKECR